MKSSTLPNFPKLYLDFLERSPAVQPFFPSSPDRDSLRFHAAEVLLRSYNREDICEVLKRQAGAYWSGTKAIDNINRLMQSQTVVVLSSLSPGLLGGPMANFLKCLTTIKLADSLQEKSISAVPIFWIRSDVDNSSEMNLVRVTDQEGKIRVIGFDESAETDSKSSRAGWRSGPMLKQLEGYVKGRGTLRAVYDAYADGIGLVTAFGRLLSAVFEEWGPIILDPCRDDFAAILVPIATKLLAEKEKIYALIGSQTERLNKEGYQAFTEDPLLLFFGGSRQLVAVEPVGEDFKVGDRVISQKDVFQSIGAESVPFRPAPLLTPICQQWILPVAANVTGLSELSGFALTLPLFNLLSLEAPLVWPRVSTTIMNSRDKRILEKYDRRLENLYPGSESVLQGLIRDKLKPTTAQDFETVMREVENRLTRLGQELPSADRDLGSEIEDSRSKITYQLCKLRDRFIAANALREEAMGRQIRRLCNSLAPNGQLQEQQLGGLDFLGRYPQNFLHDLYDKIDIWHFQHQVVLVD